VAQGRRELGFRAVIIHCLLPEKLDRLLHVDAMDVVDRILNDNGEEGIGKLGAKVIDKLKVKGDPILHLHKRKNFLVDEVFGLLAECFLMGGCGHHAIVDEFEVQNFVHIEGEFLSSGGPNHVECFVAHPPSVLFCIGCGGQFLDNLVKLVVKSVEEDYIVYSFVHCGLAGVDVGGGVLVVEGSGTRNEVLFHDLESHDTIAIFIDVIHLVLDKIVHQFKDFLFGFFLGLVEVAHDGRLAFEDIGIVQFYDHGDP
jgi:hypothetical protein